MIAVKDSFPNYPSCPLVLLMILQSISSWHFFSSLKITINHNDVKFNPDCSSYIEEGTCFFWTTHFFNLSSWWVDIHSQITLWWNEMFTELLSIWIWAHPPQKYTYISLRKGLLVAQPSTGFARLKECHSSLRLRCILCQWIGRVANNRTIEG